MIRPVEAHPQRIYPSTELNLCTGFIGGLPGLILVDWLSRFKSGPEFFRTRLPGAKKPKTNYGSHGMVLTGYEVLYLYKEVTTTFSCNFLRSFND